MSAAEAVADFKLGAATFKSVADMWHHRCHSTPESQAMVYRRGDDWVSLTWKEAAAIEREIANGLRALGLQSEERCAIVADTCVDWILADLGILCAGGATTTIFPSSPAAECGWILRDSGASYVFCDTVERLEALRALREDVPEVRRAICFADIGDDGWAMSLRLLREAGRTWAAEHPDAYDQASDGIQPDHLATLMYTSGTTGEPKGVMLTHDSWVYVAAAVDALGMISPADKQYLFLPLSHVFAKVMQVVFVRLGVPTVVHDGTANLVDNLGQTNPTWMGGVPRVFEKLHNRVVAEARSSGAMRYATFRWALGIGREVSRLRQQGQEPTGLLRLRYNLADRLVFQTLKARLGGRIRFFISGAAPLPREIAEFFHALDILILEGYGLTESSAASCINSADDYVFGTVGKPVPGCRVKIAEDGEILLNSRAVMRGYYNRPDDTDAALETDSDGDVWLHTGDIGEILDSGHVRITDRKKEIIVTAAGKNIAPAQYQNLATARSPYLSHVVLHGDSRPYCVALVTIDDEHVGRWAEEQGLTWTDYADLAGKPEVRALVQSEIDALNRELPSFQQVKKHLVLKEQLTVDNGMLTPTLKVKRRVVEARYREHLDRFYEGTVDKIDT